MTDIPRHPGQYVRETFLGPRGISVTEAAKLIGISRPGVSNFLNGKVSVTENIAVRVERVFGMPKADLLRMQADYDAAVASQESAPSDTKTYVPPFLGIQANEVEDWADHNIPARVRLSVLLRTLVHSTGVGLESVEFHGNDDAERPGWDGLIVASAGTPWIPKGKSGWEFGVNVDVKTKADGDFNKSVKAHKDAKKRAEITFVFVTPRRWAGKEAWAQAMRAKELWKDVRVYDASDIEQWLEQSPAGQTWFANEIKKPAQGVRSLDQCWSDWADVANPPISPILFDTAKEIGQPKLKSFLEKPASAPFVIAADSVEEALAFLAQAFGTPELEANRDKVLVFDQTGTLPKLAQGMQDFIAVVHTREVERELAPHVHKLRSIVIYPRNATNEDPTLILETLGYEAFRKGLEAMEMSRDEVARLGNESGHSLTVLRRRLSKVEAVRTPQWASDHDTARSLIPMVLIGAWNAKGAADQVTVSLLAGEKVEYDTIEQRLQAMLRLNDAAVWSIGNFRGVVSKLDALFAISHAITVSDLDRFLEIAKLVLGEDDPTLDLPEKDRWLSDLHGKRREFSGALRKGVGETLVLLAVHGKNLFLKRLGFDGEIAASRLVRELLLPLTTRKLEANQRDLPVYAEAAPDAFLKILEDDLRELKPQVLGLIRPTDTSMFGASSPRTGLLWALEGLAWNPDTFMRTVLILARLSQVELKDNLANKPIASLGAIFRAWMPQTAADHDARVKAVAVLLEKFPEVGWIICLGQFGGFGTDVGSYSHKPSWRADGYGFGEPFRFNGPRHGFQVAMVEMALARPTYTVKMIGDLIERLNGVGPDYQRSIWKIVEDWRKGGASDDDVAELREKIRRTVLSRRGRRRSSDSGFAALTEAARKIYDLLEPTSLINKYEWLFRQSWVEESVDEIEDEERDFKKREERIARLRVDALKAILETQGIEGIFALASKGNAQGQIGWHTIRNVLPKTQIAVFIDEALQPGVNELTPERKNLVFGSLQALTEEDRIIFLREAGNRLPESDFVRLLLLSPYLKSTWAAVDEISPTSQNIYWQEVYPTWIYEPVDNNNESVERLLKAKRPRAAFEAVHFGLEHLRPSHIVELLTAIAKESNEKDGEYQLRDYDLKQAFTLLDRNPDLTLDEKAGLEFAYIDILAQMFERGERHIVNLERYIEAHPEMWVQALAWAYKRKNRGEDPEPYKLPEGRQDLAQRGHRLLEGIRRIPGEGSDGKIDRDRLAAWIATVREASAELDRADMCDTCLGQMLSHAPVGADGIWPCEPVRDVMEDLQSESLFEGAHIGLYNSRGVVWRGEGGDQERELAQKYRRWGEALRFTHPQLSASLLMDMAKTYERQAEREDEEAGIRRRLRH
ncbi:HigA family addiction module antitoxin [Rhizobium leguminosarum]|uniref:HigA family addiction module antitoxin n=1 Tax=Rhizobium leguminosarum TaxID=384 RepID=UPI0009335218|nr:HigA family addiction module antitoxin [Rhizobium leguminosarum]